MNTLILILQLLPAIIGAAKSIEEAIPMPAAGKDKLDLILGIASDVFNGGTGLAKGIAPETAIQLIASTVGRVVKLLNLFGVFKTSTPATPAIKLDGTAALS